MKIYQEGLLAEKKPCKAHVAGNRGTRHQDSKHIPTPHNDEHHSVVTF